MGQPPNEPPRVTIVVEHRLNIPRWFLVCVALALLGIAAGWLAYFDHLAAEATQDARSGQPWVAPR